MKIKLLQFRTLPPFVLLIMLILTLLIILISVSYEYRARQTDYLNLLEKQAQLFIQSLSGTTQQALAASGEMENVLNDQVFSTLHLIDNLDSQNKANETVLSSIVGTGSIEALCLYDYLGRYELGKADSSFFGYSLSPNWIKAHLQIIKYDTMVSLYEPMLDDAEQLAAIIPRSKGGLICAMIGTESIRRVREQTGLGHFLKQFKSSQAIQYVVIQNSYTILAGHFDGYQLSSFDEDSLLYAIYQSEAHQFRIVQYEQPVYETISPFKVDGQSVAVLRIGLSMDEFQKLKGDINRRLLIIFIIIGVSVILFVNLLFNVRLRQMAQREFEQLSHYADTLLQNLSSGVMSVDSHHQIQSVNKKGIELLNLKNAVVLQQSIQILPNQMADYIEKVLASPLEEHQAIQVNLSNKDEYKILQVRANVIKNTETGSTCILLLDDISHQTQLEAETRRNQRLLAMRDLAASVAHEIKNPLNGIHLLVQLIRKKSSELSGMQSQFETIEGEIHRIGHIVDEYLRWARPLQLERKQVDISQIIRDTALLFHEEFESKKIELKLNVAETMLHVDSDQLKQVFINLMKNSGEAIESEGEIIITGHSIDKCYQIQIQDTGSGIVEEDLLRIFDFYYSTKKEGSGIGLAVVQQIITAHGGQIDVASQVNVGTTFTLRLPLNQNIC